MGLPTDSGINDVLQYIVDTWNYVVLVGSDGSEITRIHIDSDGRAYWTVETASNIALVTIEVSGSDDDIVSPSATTGTTINKTQLVKTNATNTVLCEDADTDVTIEADDDTVIITHKIQL